jgi:hypothetical protein
MEGHAPVVAETAGRDRARHSDRFVPICAFLCDEPGIRLPRILASVQDTRQLLELWNQLGQDKSTVAEEGDIARCKGVCC